MQQGRQWSALSAGCYIAPTKIGDSSNARELSDDIGVCKLQSKGQLSLGLVPDGLTVAADSLHRRSIDVSFA